MIIILAVIIVIIQYRRGRGLLVTVGDGCHHVVADDGRDGHRRPRSDPLSYQTRQPGREIYINDGWNSLSLSLSIRVQRPLRDHEFIHGNAPNYYP